MYLRFMLASSVRLAQCDQEMLCAVSERPISATGLLGSVAVSGRDSVPVRDKKLIPRLKSTNTGTKLSILPNFDTNFF